MTREDMLLEPVDPFDGESEPTTSDTVVYVSGPLRFEVWEDPDRPFGCAPSDLAAYRERKAWVLLFNAVSLRKARLAPDVGS